MKAKLEAIGFLSALLLVLALVVGSIQAQANMVSVDRPDWWDTADAQVIFNQLPTAGTTGGGIAGGSAGYGYDYMTVSFPFPGAREDYLLVNLDNQEDPGKWKLFWIAAHIGGQGVGSVINNLDVEEFVLITGYDSAGNPRGVDGFDYGWNDGDWIWVEAWMFPQPDRETFLVQILSEADGFNVDYLELGTKCVVPIPSTLLLLGGGLLGIIGLRRKAK